MKVGSGVSKEKPEKMLHFLHLSLLYEQCLELPICIVT